MLIPWTHVMIGLAFFIPIMIHLAYIKKKLTDIKGKIVLSQVNISPVLDNEKLKIQPKLVFYNTANEPLFFQILEDTQVTFNDRTFPIEKMKGNFAESLKGDILSKTYKDVFLPVISLDSEIITEELAGMLKVVCMYGKSIHEVKYQAKFNLEVKIQPIRNKQHGIDYITNIHLISFKY